ncbi:MAG TPA: hypothetical protein VG097_03640 [Gemmata sp.]|jgi:hypothetical protein|nr:hypothetical protein [Gemmata sp.]
MEPKDTTVPSTSSHDEVPEGIRRARAAFIRDFPALIANRRTRGKYVCYHNEECVAVNSDYLAMIRELNARNIPENASLIIQVTSDAGREQQFFADEGEIDPD